MNTIGIVAIQGDVKEHETALKKLACTTKQVRNIDDLKGIDGIILPGGESTTMSIVGNECGLLSALKDWVARKKPIWGTCAGMILLADQATGIGGLDVKICRNYFGSQINSFILDVDDHLMDTIGGMNMRKPFKAVFIRAPAILAVGADVEILAKIDAAPHCSVISQVQVTLQEEKKDIDIAHENGLTIELSNINNIDKPTVAVAVKQGSMLATAFHPELTDDLRWHRFFLETVEAHKGSC